MLRHAIVVALVLVVAVSGCTLSRDGRRGTIITGAVMTASSVLLVRSGERDLDGSGVNDTALDDDWGAYMLGSALFIAGVSVLVGGLASSEEPEVDRSVTYLPSSASMSSASTSSASTSSASTSPASAPIADSTSTTMTASGPEAGPANGEPATVQIIEIERVPVVPLPELPATADVLRLAKQVRSAATHGRCEAAWIMWTDLQKLDAAYARALRDGPVMARCAM